MYKHGSKMFHFLNKMCFRQISLFVSRTSKLNFQTVNNNPMKSLTLNVNKVNGKGIYHLNFSILPNNVESKRSLSFHNKTVTDIDSEDSIFQKFTDISRWNQEMHFLNKQRFYGRVVYVFNKMKEMNFSPDVISYSLVIKALGRIHDYQTVLRYFEKARSEISIDRIFINTVIFALGDSGVEFSQFLNELRKHNISIGADTYNTLISVLANSKRFDEMFHYYEEMKNTLPRGPDVVTFGIIINAMGKQGCFDKVDFLLQEMKTRSVRISLPIYGSLIDNYGKHFKQEEFKQAVERVKYHPYWRNPIVLHNIMKGFAFCYDWNGFIQTYSEIVESGLVGTFTFSLLVDGYGIFGRYDLLQSAKEEAQKFNLLTANFYHTIIKAYLRCDKPIDAIDIFYELEEKGHPWYTRLVGTFLFYLRNYVPFPLQSLFLRLKDSFYNTKNWEPISQRERQLFSYFIAEYRKYLVNSPPINTLEISYHQKIQEASQKNSLNKRS